MASDRSLSMPSFPLSTLTTTTTKSPSRTTFKRARLGYRLLFTLLTLHSLHSSSSSFSTSSSFFAEAAVSCTYPNYLTEVKPGETALLTWQVSGQDVTTYDKLTATLYCMDLNGHQGGMWRGIQTLFQNKGLVSAQGQIKFAVPNCGRLANNVAIRLIATGQGSAIQNDACYFKMDPKAAAVVPPVTTTTTQAPPVTTVTKDPPVIPPTSTTNKPDPTIPPPTQPPGISTTVSGTPPPPPIPTNSQTAFPTTVTTISGTVISIPYPSTKPYPPLPPLPPLTDPLPPLTDPLPPSPPSSSSGEDGSGSNQLKTLLASICSGAALVIIVSLFILRRRRTMRNGRRGVNNNHGLKLPHLKQLHGRNKSDHKEGHFHLMHDDNDYDNPEMDHEVALAAASTKAPKMIQPLPPPSQAPPPMPVLIDISPESAEKINQHTANYRDSSLSYPPNAHLDPSWRRSASFPYPTYSDDEYTMSSMRSSCETSSVVREYWAASMAARTERRLEGYPPTIDFYDEGSVFGDHHRRTPSFSSVSRKAEIMTLDSASIAESNVLPAADGFLKRHYRNTMNSVQSYLQRSMTMSLTSLHSTFTSSSEEENSGAGYGTRSRGNGFRPPIDSEFLSHLNIKSLRSEERQLEYYTHLYRQNPTMSTANYDDCENQAARPSILTGDSRRTSSVPSLTSTNDPFKTFDSNEILLDMSPFADHHAILPASPNMVPSTSLSPRVRPASPNPSSTERNPATAIGGGSTETTPTNSYALMVVNASSTSPLGNANAALKTGGVDERSSSTFLGSLPILPPTATTSTDLVRSTTASSGHSSSSGSNS
ncbi:hypothetical protein BGW39_008188 [Mortierella sp. 14UC]|nr:hypothetical protein BGW39_008188 [Mortierella sp. 14UC]